MVRSMYSTQRYRPKMFYRIFFYQSSPQNNSSHPFLADSEPLQVPPSRSQLSLHVPASCSVLTRRQNLFWSDPLCWTLMGICTYIVPKDCLSWSWSGNRYRFSSGGDAVRSTALFRRTDLCFWYEDNKNNYFLMSYYRQWHDRTKPVSH